MFQCLGPQNPDLSNPYAIYIHGRTTVNLPESHFKGSFETLTDSIIFTPLALETFNSNQLALLPLSTGHLPWKFLCQHFLVLKHLLTSPSSSWVVPLGRGLITRCRCGGINYQPHLSSKTCATSRRLPGMGLRTACEKQGTPRKRLLNLGLSFLALESIIPDKELREEQVSWVKHPALRSVLPSFYV